MDHKHDHDHHNHHEQFRHALPTSESSTTTAVQAAITSTTTSQIDGLVNSLTDNDVAQNIGHSSQHHHHHQDHPMKMFFHGGCQEVILFDFWRTDSFCGLFFALIVVFLMGVLYEGVKWFRVYFQLWTSSTVKKQSNCVVSMNGIKKARQQGVEDVLIEKASANPSADRGCGACEGGVGEPFVVNTLTSQEVYAPTVVRSVPAGSAMPMNRWTWLMMYVSHEFSPSTCKLIETAIYIFQLTLAYWLMLIAMTFNTYLTAAVVLGAGFGHWLFANLKCAPPRRCFCPGCCDSSGGPEQVDNFASDACH